MEKFWWLCVVEACKQKHVTPFHTRCKYTGEEAVSAHNGAPHIKEMFTLNSASSKQLNNISFYYDDWIAKNYGK